MINCTDCNIEIEKDDSAYSTVTTMRAYKGQHTGDIYFCESCQKYWIDNFLTRRIEPFYY